MQINIQNMKYACSRINSRIIKFYTKKHCFLEFPLGGILINPNYARKQFTAIVLFKVRNNL